MGLLSNRTHRFFILPSSTEAEERHIHDIAFGVKILLYKGIDYNDISVIIDHAPCYAGIFNQMPLSTHLGLSKNPKCQMVAVGGTGLFSSVSAPQFVQMQDLYRTKPSYRSSIHQLSYWGGGGVLLVFLTGKMLVFVTQSAQLLANSILQFG